VGVVLDLFDFLLFSMSSTNVLNDWAQTRTWRTNKFKKKKKKKLG
jgi:hypothetical protein